MKAENLLHRSGKELYRLSFWGVQVNPGPLVSEAPVAVSVTGIPHFLQIGVCHVDLELLPRRIYFVASLGLSSSSLLSTFPQSSALQDPASILSFPEASPISS
jgi:hypothetical protein